MSGPFGFDDMHAFQESEGEWRMTVGPVSVPDECFPIQHNPDAVFMQATGLRDRNGIDIFECDLIQFKDLAFGPHPVEGVVHWAHADAQFQIQETRPDDMGCYYLHDFNACAEACVIGNVFEHRHLLPMTETGA